MKRNHLRELPVGFKRLMSGRAIASFLIIVMALGLSGKMSLGQSEDAGGKIKPPTAAKSMSTKNAKSAQGAIATVLQPNRSPLITFRILFMTGSASDPEGKEGVADLTASMLAEGGSRRMTYEQITDAFYPMATSFSSQVDKEMTVFSGTTHLDNLDRYYGIISQMLLEPGFRQEDFTRLKTDAINYLKVSLREANDEELGKEQL